MPPSAATIPEVTLVCCHYLGGSALEWSGVASYLEPRFSVMGIDFPGFGDAAALDGYSVESMAAYTANLIRGRRTEHWVLVGHSMGGKVASLIARWAEDGAVGLDGLLSLIHVAGSPPSPEPMEDSKRTEMKLMFSGDEASSRKDAERYITQNIGTPLEPSSYELAVRDAMRTNRAAWLAWLNDGSLENWTSAVGRLSTPALLVTGEKDTALGTAPQRKFMLPHLQNGTLVELVGAGHLLPLERPKEIAELVNTHVEAVLRSNARGAAVLTRYAEVVGSSRVGQGTRDALRSRLESKPGSALNREELNTLRAVTNCVIPEANRSFDLADRIAQMLTAGQGDGWRPDALPPDCDAYRGALATLNAAAKGMRSRDFPSLDAPQQDEILQQAADGRLGVANGLLNANQMQAWFEDARADCTRLYLAHPETLARIGYSGIANGGDGQPKSGFVEIGVAAREDWEPVGVMRPPK